MQIYDTRWGKTAKFLQTLNGQILETLQREAEARNITLQELIRAVIVPDWVRSQKSILRMEPVKTPIRY